MSKLNDFPKLAAPAERALAAAGVERLEQLTQFSEAEVKSWHGLGPNALNQLRHALRARGLSLAGENKMESTNPENLSPEELITRRIAELGDWRGELMARVRILIREVAPEAAEEWKWGTAIWSCQGNVVGAGAFKEHLKLNFFKGASLPDPRGLFNAGLEAKATRAIDFSEGVEIDESALRELIRAAVDFNLASKKK